MPLPKELTTVTPLSKGLALSMFILLPFIAFIVGVNYGESIISEQMTKASLKSEIIAVTSPTLTSTPTNAVKIDTKNWNTKTIALYKLSFQLPLDWTLQEVNRRPEPTGPIDPKTGHDCADYIIKNADSSTSISLKPLCGYGDGGPVVWQDDAVVIKHGSGFKAIIRYFDINKKKYIYANANETQYSDMGDGKKVRTHSGILTFGTDKDFNVVRTELSYTGPAAQKEQSIAEADAVIASIERH